MVRVNSGSSGYITNVVQVYPFSCVGRTSEAPLVAAEYGVKSLTQTSS